MFNCCAWVYILKFCNLKIVSGVVDARKWSAKWRNWNISDIFFSLSSSSDVTEVPYTILFILPHRKSPRVVRSGDHAVHITGPPLPIHWFGYLTLRWFRTFLSTSADGCIRTPKRIVTNCDNRSCSKFVALQHPNRAFPGRDSFLNNNQFAVLHNILSVVGVSWDTLYKRPLQHSWSWTQEMFDCKPMESEM